MKPVTGNLNTISPARGLKIENKHDAMIKKLVRSFVDSLGYTVVKKDNSAAQKVEADLSMYRQIYPEATLREKRFYNVGSGSFSHPYWTNLDYVSDWYKDVQHGIVHIDLMKLEPLPMPDNSAEVIYTSHTIEHVKDNAVQNLFKESYRALKPGGFLRVTTGPDADNDFEALLRKDTHWFYWDEWYNEKGSYETIYHNPPASMPIEQRWLHHVASQLDPNDISPSKVKLSAEEIRKLVSTMQKEQLLDHLTSLCEFQPERPGNHVSWWNAAKIERFMRQAGFSNVYRSAFEQSKCPILRNSAYFDNTHPQISVYVEAIKD